MASCPNKNHEEWKHMIQLLGEQEAYRAFIANGEQLLSIADTVRLAASIRNKHYQSNLTEKLKQDNRMTEKPDNSDPNSTYRKGLISVGRLTSKILPKFFIRELKEKDASPGEMKANFFWDNNNINPDEKLNILGQPTTRAEFVKHWDLIVEQSRVKGTILHLMLERTWTKDETRRAEITDKISDIAAQVGIINAESGFEWVKNPETLKKAIRILGINIFDEPDPSKRDEILPEHTIVSELLGFGATMDMFVAHADGLYSIVELKTGRTFGERIFNRLMKYGDQTIGITDNAREHAKLQVMLQAFALKVENPEIQFRNLFVHWIPDSFYATIDDPNKAVEVQAYLKMIEDYYKNEEPEVYKKILEKSPDAFNSIYYSNASTKLANEIAKDSRPIDNIIEDKLLKLKLLRNAGQNVYNQKEIAKLTSDIAMLVKDSSMDFRMSGELLALSEDMELSTYKKWLGNKGDVHNPLIQLFARFLSDRTQEMEEDYNKKFRTFQSLLKAVKDEYMAGKASNIVDTVTNGGLNFINTERFYEFMWKEGRFITEKDAEWNTLTLTQKKFVKYTNDILEQSLNEAFDMPERKNVYNGKIETYRDIYQKEHPAYKQEYGFAPKVPAKAGELFQRYGFGQQFREAWKEAAIERYTESFYNQNNKVVGLPIKYLGNPTIEAKGSYTKNVEVIFDLFVRGITRKVYLDDVYHLGYGLRDIMAMYADPKDQRKYFENSIDFIEHRITSDILSQKRESKMARKSLKIGGRDINVDQVIRGAKHATSWSTMWLKPIQGTANTIFTWLVTAKESVVGSISGSMGIGADFTFKDFMNAHADWKDMQLAAAQGKLRENKTFLMLRKLRFLPDNFDYASRDDDYITKTNRWFSESTMYMFHTMGEEWNATLMMVAMMRRMKLKNGTSIWDNYKVQDVDAGNGVFYKDVVWTGGIRGLIEKKIGDKKIYTPLEGLDSHEIELMKRVYQKTHGGYRKDERVMMDMYAVGEAFLQYKKYLPATLDNLFGSKGMDTYLGEWLIQEKEVEGKKIDVYEWHQRQMEGRFRVLYKWLLATSYIGGLAYKALGGKDSIENYNWDSLSPEQRRGLLNILVTASAWGAMLIGYFAAFGGDDEDDPYKKTTKRIIDNFSQQYNIYDMLRAMRNPAAFVTKAYNTIGGMSQMMVASAYYITGDTSKGGGAFTQRGDFRGWNVTQKNIPFMASIYDIRKFLEGAIESTDDIGGRWVGTSGRLF